MERRREASEFSTRPQTPTVASCITFLSTQEQRAVHPVLLVSCEPSKATSVVQRAVSRFCAMTPGCMLQEETSLSSRDLFSNRFHEKGYHRTSVRRRAEHSQRLIEDDDLGDLSPGLRPRPTESGPTSSSPNLILSLRSSRRSRFVWWPSIARGQLELPFKPANSRVSARLLHSSLA